MTAVIALGLAAPGAALMLAVAGLIAHDRTDDHAGADHDYANQLAAMADTTVLPAIPMDMADIAAECPDELAPTGYQGRHHEDTVGWVPAGWMPPTAGQRIAAAIDDTQQMEAISA